MLLSSASVGTIFANSFEKGWIGTVLLTRLASPLTPSCDGPVTNLFRRLLLAPRCVSSATHRKPPCFTSSDSTHSFFFFNLFFLFESRLHCYLVWIIMQYKDLQHNFYFRKWYSTCSHPSLSVVSKIQTPHTFTTCPVCYQNHTFNTLLPFLLQVLSSSHKVSFQKHIF